MIDEKPQAESSPAAPRSAGEALYRDLPSGESATPQSEAPLEEVATETQTESDPVERKDAKPAPKQDDDDEISEKPTSRAGKRIQRLVAEKHELEVKLAEARGQLKTTPSPAAEAPKPAEKPKAADAPKLADFKTVEDWETATLEYLRKSTAEDASAKVAEAIAKDRAEREANEKKAKAEAEKKAAAKAWIDRTAETKKRNPDYQETVFGEDGKMHREIPYNDVIDRFLANSKIGPDILYFIAKNPKEGEAIVESPDVFDQFRLLVAIESSLQAKLKAPSTNGTRAPKPPSTIDNPAPKPKDRTVAEVLYG